MKDQTVKKLLLFSFVLTACIVAISLGMEAKTDISYIPYNGDWQHYNMFRRLLDGQTPFVDFPLVLGQAVLFINSAVLRIIGNSFANSIFSTTFIGWMAGFLIFSAIVSLFTEKNTVCAGSSLAMMMVILLFAPVQSLGFIANNRFLSSTFSFLDLIFSKFAVLYLPGNSSRPTRMAVIAIYLILFSVLFPKTKWEKSRWWKEAIIFGAIGGIMILWANDYGSASYIGASLCFFLIMLKKTDFLTTVKSSILYVAVTLVVVFSIMEIITRGKVQVWLKQTFAITDFLWWYDGVFFDRKRLGFWQYPPFSGECWLPIAVSFAALIIWIFLLFRKERTEKQAAKNIMVLTTSFAFLYLNLLKNGYEEQYTNIFIVYIYLLSAFIVVQVIKKLLGKTNIQTVAKTGALILCLLVVGVSITYAINSIKYAMDHSIKTETYIDALGGNCYEWANDLNLAYEKIGDASLFSTYGSALEVMKGTKQPTRYDYITHVFGDEARKEYLGVFRDVDPEYVSILNRDYTRWEAWACNANWFFYREIADCYRYEFSNTFCRYLKKSNESNRVETQITADIVPLNDSQVSIKLSATKTDTILIADVCIRYRSQLVKGNKKWMTVNRLVAVTGTSEYLYPREDFDAWFIPNISEEYYLPIIIENGEGEITISCYPSECASLYIDSLEIEDVYDAEKLFGSYEGNQ